MSIYMENFFTIDNKYTFNGNNQQSHRQTRIKLQRFSILIISN